MTEPIVFFAALAGTNSSAKWLTLSSDNDAKIVLEVPASELAAVMRLAAQTKRLLRVTVEPE